MVTEDEDVDEIIQREKETESIEREEEEEQNRALRSVRDR